MANAIHFDQSVRKFSSFTNVLLNCYNVRRGQEGTDNRLMVGDAPPCLYERTDQMKKLLTLTIAFVGTIAVVGIIAAGCAFSPTHHDVEASPMYMEGHREANRSVAVRGSLTTDGYSSGMRYLSMAGVGVPLAESAAPAADAIGRERFAEFKENDFREVKTNPLSTFGLDVDTASYTTMRRYLTESKRLPPKDSKIFQCEYYVSR